MTAARDQQQERAQHIVHEVTQAVHDRIIPGAVLAWGSLEGSFVHQAFGAARVHPSVTPAYITTIYDVASLTKVVATWPLVVQALQQHALSLDDPLARLLPQAQGSPSAGIALRQLLTHTAGLMKVTWLSRYPRMNGAILHRILHEPLDWAPGTALTYTDRPFIVLGFVLEQVYGAPLDVLCRERVFEPLGMGDTTFQPSPALHDRVAPTEVRNGQCLTGEVHDENAAWMGGVAGHAGLFSTTTDLSRFARAVLEASPVLGGPEGIQASFRDYTGHLGGSRGLAWDSYSDWGRPEVWGHTGFTGTVLWLDFSSREYLVLLSNRVHPQRPDPALMARLRRCLFEAWQDPMQ